jgi:hypothetical protein
MRPRIFFKTSDSNHAPVLYFMGSATKAILKTLGESQTRQSRTAVPVTKQAISGMFLPEDARLKQDSSYFQTTSASI